MLSLVLHAHRHKRAQAEAAAAADHLAKMRQLLARAIRDPHSLSDDELNVIDAFVLEHNVDIDELSVVCMRSIALASECEGINELRRSIWERNARPACADDREAQEEFCRVWQCYNELHNLHRQYGWLVPEPPHIDADPLAV